MSDDPLLASSPFSDLMPSDLRRLVKGLELLDATLSRSARRESLPDAAAVFEREARAVRVLVSTIRSFSSEVF